VPAVIACPRLVRTALAAEGLVVERVVALSGHGHSDTFRLDLAGGRRAKMRVYRDRVSAARVERRLRESSVGVLPEVLVRVGRRLIVEHVEGNVLDVYLRASPVERRRLVRATGRLLARLHGGPDGVTVPVGLYQRVLSLAAGRLVRRRQMSRADATRLATISRPARALAGLTHGDPAPENLVLTPSGRLRAIDEERVAVRPVAYDLARAICRWPLDPAEEAALLAAYSAAGGPAREFRQYRRFWIAAALATSAVYRMRYRPNALGPIVKELKNLAVDG
jgi:hypothetical protein